MEVVADLRHPLGTSGWGLSTFGKYVLLGNYELGLQGSGLVGGAVNIADQQVGLFDSERKSFCVIDLDPTQSANAGVEWLVTANPSARQSRVYFQGFLAQTGGYSLGYIVADLDHEAPCDPESGWSVVGYTPTDINSAAADLLMADPTKIPCPGDFCGFDGLALLNRDTTSGTDTLVINNWWHQRIITLTVNQDGEISVVDVYHTDAYWRPEEADGACMQLYPVVRPAVDPTSDPTDLRFAVGYDQLCHGPGGTDGCASSNYLCPSDGTACSPNDSCPGSVCTSSYADCSTNGDCTAYDEHCTNACLAVHPGLTCTTTGNPCARNSNCPFNDKCICGPGRPLQEFSYDGAQISPTSDRFQTSAYRNNHVLGIYDSSGGLWAAEMPHNNAGLVVDPGPAMVASYESSNGSSGYHDFSDANSSSVHDPERLAEFPRLRWHNTPTHAHELDGKVYVVGRDTLQKWETVNGAWAKDENYIVSLGTDILQRRSRRCTAGSGAGQLCSSNSDCGESGNCPGIGFGDGIGEIFKADLVFGGSPPSLWVTPRFLDPSRTLIPNSWLVRVPVPGPIPDSTSPSRPTILWTSDPICGPSCDRLWMFFEHDGQLRFRIRTAGQWTSAYNLPNNTATSGGATAILYDGKIEIYSRSSTGTVVTTVLNSGVGCEPASCSWSAWTALPGTMTTDAEPAATVQSFGSNQGPFVAVRRASDGRVAYTRRNGSSWAAWKLAGTLVKPDGAPAVVSVPEDQSGRIWILAIRPSNGEVYWARVTDGLTFGSWTLGTSRPSSVSAWGASPTAVHDGTRVRVFVPALSAKSVVWQSTRVGNGSWDAWAPIRSEGESDFQPSATIVNGDVTLVTHTEVGSSEQFVR